MTCSIVSIMLSFLRLEFVPLVEMSVKLEPSIVLVIAEWTGNLQFILFLAKLVRDFDSI